MGSAPPPAATGVARSESLTDFELLDVAVGEHAEENAAVAGARPGSRHVSVLCGETRAVKRGDARVSKQASKYLKRTCMQPAQRTTTLGGAVKKVRRQNRSYCKTARPPVHMLPRVPLWHLFYLSLSPSSHFSLSRHLSAVGIQDFHANITEIHYFHANTNHGYCGQPAIHMCSPLSQ